MRNYLPHLHTGLQLGRSFARGCCAQVFDTNIKNTVATFLIWSSPMALDPGWCHSRPVSAALLWNSLVQPFLQFMQAVGFYFFSP
jgi:hypothetical protein